MNKLTTTNIKYLIAINQLYNNQNGVRCTDLANMLGVSKPSVHRMIETMKNIGLIDKDRYGEIFFTQEGQEIAEKYSKYYDLFSNSLSRITSAETDIMSGICAFFAEFSTDEIEKMHNNLLSV